MTTTTTWTTVKATEATGAQIMESVEFALHARGVLRRERDMRAFEGPGQSTPELDALLVRLDALASREGVA